MSAEVSQNYGAPSQSIAGPKEVNYGVGGQVMGQLAHQHHIDAFVSEGWGPGTAYRHGESLVSSQAGRGPVQLQSNGKYAEPAARGPPHGDPREVAQTSTEVEQSQGGAGSNACESAFQTKADGGGSPEPAICPGDVP